MTVLRHLPNALTILRLLLVPPLAVLLLRGDYEAALWVAAKLGAAYTGATGFVESCARRAEVYLAGAMLFKRRASFVDSGATQGLERQAYLERRGYLEDAARLHECALAALREALLYLGLPTDALNDAPALAVGHIETGPYPPTSAGALNVG